MAHMNKRHVLIIRGYPGSGKTSVGKTLEHDGYGRFVDHNAILTFIASITGDDEGIYDDIHSLELAMVRKILADDSSVIVARGFSSAASIRPYRDVVKRSGCKVTIIRLQAELSELKVGVQAIERKTEFNPTVSAEALQRWIKNNPIEPVDDEVIIDASPDLQSVVAAAKRCISAAW